ncbi:platelet endothelial cell adhesion molecule-like isoform X2 [Scyliorhinus canicula]|uniref:platelet endothelial cell adhesion molecule-like isoform X2 n=1 Tax=Scyliorhinus canicula TaxID=7830 RepID=UPI0018F6F9E3|nr:platelet endothelial cell adhesion molecule-like isoform X2 [Scyliorhinus canicula]XP_038644255.1 platelet endothelial cell adhesion molecule-like isoform X2 [Scyliorhinus canicula]XP_038644256.1 platelet endothelial cell adhesion molecule-like isoform X2 [Scyliorhinus canicula]
MKSIGLFQIFLHLGYQGTSQAHRELQVLSPRSDVIQEGDTLKLQCGYTATRTCNWLKDDAYIKKFSTNIYETIVDQHSGGRYQCCCNSFMWCRRREVVITAADTTKVSLQIEPRAALIGDIILMKCAVSEPVRRYDFLWYKNGNAMPRSHEAEKTIRWAASTDEAQYRCGFKVNYRQWLSPVINVTVTDLSLQADPPVVLEGDYVNLTCRHPAYYRRSTYVNFYKGDTQRSRVLANNREARHTFKVNGSNDSGFYYCKLDNMQSIGVRIQVNELFSQPELKADAENIEGQYLRVECNVKTSYSAISFQYSFRKNNETVALNQVQKFMFKTSASLSDSGLYHCEANALGRGVRKKSEAMYIYVKEAFSKPTLSDNGQIFVGQQLNVTCEVQINPSCSSLRYVFFRSGQALNLSTIGKSYIVEQAQLDDSGTYLCEVTNTERSVKKRSDPISVKIHPNPVSTPQLTIHPRSDVIEWETAWLSCSVPSGTPPINYRFYKEPSLDIYQQMSNLTSFTYEIGNVSRYDGGSYYCLAGNQATEHPLQSEQIVLSVIVPVAGASLVSKDNLTVIAAGHRLVLQCELKEGTTPRLLWYKDNLQLTNNSESYHLNAEGNELVVDSFEAHHGGRYHCVAINRGIDEMMFNTTSNYFEAALSVRSYSTEVTASVLPLLLIAGVIAIIGFKLREKKQGNSSKVFQPQSGTPEARPEPTSQEVSPTNFEYAVIGSSLNTEAASDLVYSAVTIQKSKTAVTGIYGGSSEGSRITTGDPNDYCITYATLNHKMTTERLDTMDMADGSGADTNVYENLPRK